ncbi:MarR family winged helix-turn-helix transcriptional regulator [Thermostaphylospora chromogena]|uniref:DNA-binding transcriptional regulator, MarR family n=1 Tax=Thermostaphylospora chromogena TaxID=35622 RepID=A0A1H1H3M6_9ACTN|nr:MarR family transcriptional regulator [Thermostaphylospora chromogena]SDR20105.1 DNA-binding transcriptional regulator, MarR family [Thermostaphylospora chromogena]
MTDQREELIRRIGDLKRQLGRHLAYDRSLPLLASNLTMQQLKTVILLSSLGSASGQELAHRLGVSLATVTGIVDRLVGHGLVTRQEDPADRRIRRVRLSAQGRALADDITHAGAHAFSRILQRLDTSTLQALEGVLAEICAVAAELYRDVRDEPVPHRKVG